MAARLYLSTLWPSAVRLCITDKPLRTTRRCTSVVPERHSLLHPFSGAVAKAGLRPLRADSRASVDGGRAASAGLRGAGAVRRPAARTDRSFATRKPLPSEALSPSFPKRVPRSGARSPRTLRRRASSALAWIPRECCIRSSVLRTRAVVPGPSSLPAGLPTDVGRQAGRHLSRHYSSQFNGKSRLPAE